MNKQYSNEAVLQFCQSILKTMALYDSQDERFAEYRSELLPWIEELGSWGYLYDRPVGELFSEMMALMGLPAESLMPPVTELSEPPLDIELDLFTVTKPEVKEEAAGLVTLMILTWRGHMRAMDMFNQGIDELLDKAFAEERDDDALFKAVLADRAVLGSADVQARIAEAALVSDEVFFTSLSKALTQTKPRRPKPEYDDLRFLLGALDDQLGLYPDEGEDPVAGLKKLIINTRNQRGK